MVDFRNNNLSHQAIDIDITKGISIHLTKEEYKKFITTLLPDLESQIIKSELREKKSDNKFEICRKFVEEIRDVFYDCSDGYCVSKECSEICFEKLKKIIDKNSHLLGLI